MKKTLIAAALCLASTSAMAAAFQPLPPEPVQPAGYGKFYLGGSVGIDHQFYDTEYRFVDAQEGNVGDVEMDLGNHGVSGRVHGGWGWYFPNKLYLALEGHATYSDAKSNHSFVTTSGAGETDTVKVRMRGRYRYGGDGIVGYSVTEHTMPWIQGGYTRGKMRSRFTDETPETVKDSRNRSGFDIGGGIRTTVAENVDMFIKYEYVRLSKFDRNLLTDVEGDTIDVNYDRPNFSNTSVGINVYFG